LRQRCTNSRMSPPRGRLGRRPFGSAVLPANAADLKVHATKMLNTGGRNGRRYTKAEQAGLSTAKKCTNSKERRKPFRSQSGKAANVPSRFFRISRPTFAAATPIVKIVSALEQCSPKSGHKQDAGNTVPTMRRHIQFSELGMKGQSGSSRAL